MRAEQVKPLIAATVKGFAALALVRAHREALKVKASPVATHDVRSPATCFCNG